MNIRSLELEDVEEIRRIHEKFFEGEFEFPDFLNNFLCSFVVKKDKDIVVAGGVRMLAEAILITDKEYPIIERRKALHQALDACAFITKRADFSQLHAFVKGDNWIRHLGKVGFSPTKGHALVLDLR